MEGETQFVSSQSDTPLTVLTPKLCVLSPSTVHCPLPVARTSVEISILIIIVTTLAVWCPGSRQLRWSLTPRAQCGSLGLLLYFSVQADWSIFVLFSTKLIIDHPRAGLCEPPSDISLTREDDWTTCRIPQQKYEDCSSKFKQTLEGKGRKERPLFHPLTFGVGVVPVWSPFNP